MYLLYRYLHLVSRYYDPLMLEALFGNRTAEKVLLYIGVNREAYALEIAKRFSTPKSSQFINGILDGVLKGRRAEVPPA